MKRRSIFLLGGLGVLLIAAGYAAFYLSTTPIDGEANTAGAPEVAWTGNNLSATTLEGAGECDATFRQSNGTYRLEVDVADAGPGLLCEFKGHLQNQGNEHAALLGSSIGTDNPAVASWVEVRDEGCGHVMEHHPGSASNASTATVYVAFTDELEASTTLDLSGGVEWVSASVFDEDECLQ